MTSTAVATALAIAARRWDARAALARCALPDAAAAMTLAAGAAPLDDAAVRAVRPPGWQHCDASWLDAATEDLDATSRAIVLGPRIDPLACWLARRHLGHLTAMPAPGPARGLDELPRLAARALARTLAALGRRQLAHALADRGATEQAAVASRLPWGRELAGEIAAVRALGAGADAMLGSRRSAAARAAGLRWTDADAAATAGARALAPQIGAVLAAQLAQRLPMTLGLAVRAVVTGPFARAPVDAVAAAEIQRAIDHGSVGA